MVVAFGFIYELKGVINSARAQIQYLGELGLRKTDHQ